MRAARHTHSTMRKIRLKFGKFVLPQRGCRIYGHKGVFIKGVRRVDAGTPLLSASVFQVGSEIELNEFGS